MVVPSATVVSRRSVLQVAGATIVTIGISFATASAASAAQVTAGGTTDGIPFTTKLAPIAGRSQEVPRQLGAVLQQAEVASSGGVIEFEFSPRLYRASEQPFVVVGGTPVAAKSTIAKPDPSTGLQRVTVTIPDSVRAGQTLTVIAGALHPVSYPLDLVILEQSATATKVRRRRGGPQSDLARRGAQEPLQVWGCELAGLFQQVDWSEGRYGFVPVGFSLTSVGPGPVPKGATIELRGDARLLKSLTPATASIDDGTVLVPKARVELQGDLARVRVTVAHQLDMGSRYTLVCTPETTVPSGDLDNFTTPMVVLTSHGPNDRTQRDTRMTSAVRTDSAPTLQSLTQRAGA